MENHSKILGRSWMFHPTHLSTTAFLTVIWAIWAQCKSDYTQNYYYY